MTYQELLQKNEQLSSRLEKAKTIYFEQKREIETTEKRVVGTMYRNTQKIRDELYGLGYELHQFAVGISMRPNKTMSVTQINSLQQAVEAIINCLKENNLWDKTDMIPDLSSVKLIRKLYSYGDIIHFAQELSMSRRSLPGWKYCVVVSTKITSLKWLEFFTASEENAKVFEQTVRKNGFTTLVTEPDTY